MAQQQQVKTIPAPIAGMNARDSLMAMGEQDAIALNNWWPQPYGVAIRKGYKQWVTGLPGAVETLATWVSQNNVLKMFAWSQFAMYDVTYQGVAGVPLLTGFTGNNAARWQTLLFGNDAGVHLLAVNGTDDGIIYNGAGLNRLVAGDGLAVNSWAGLDPKKASQLMSHQGRLWAVEKNTTKGWYLPVGTISGTFVSFDFGPQFKRGGYLTFLATWTIDDGNGAEDHLVAVSSSGEAVVYGGTNPNDDTAWMQVGVYFVGSPLGPRSFTKMGADLMVLTQKGVVSMSDLLSSTKVNESQQAVKTDKIQYLVASLTDTFADKFGWALKYYAAYNMLMMNVPNADGSQNRQLVSNQVTAAQPWATFSGMDAACWGDYGRVPAYGDRAGRVLLAQQGTLDDVDLNGLNGVPVTATVQQAYNMFGDASLQKQVAMYRPNFILTNPVAVSARLVYDFARPDTIVPSSVTHTVNTYADDNLTGYWNQGLWNVNTWGAGDAIDPGSPILSGSQREWIQAEGMGVSASLKLVVQTDAEVLWISTDYAFKTGGIL